MPKISELLDGTALTLKGNELWPGVQNGVTYKFTTSQITNYLTPEDYGAVGDGTTDDTAAFGLLATAINTLGGGKIRFGRGKTYKIFTTNPLPASTILMLFIGPINGLEIDFNGGTLSVATSNFTSLSFVMAFAGNDATTTIKNVRIIGPKLLHPNYSTVDDTKGLTFIQLGAICEDFDIVNLRQEGGYGGLRCVRGATPELRAKRINVTNSSFLRVFYPLNFAKSGDQVFASARTENCGRVYFPYNVSQHDIWIEDLPHGNVQPTCLIKVYGEVGTDVWNLTSDIKLHYRVIPVVGVAGNINIDCDFQQETAVTAVAAMKNILLDVHIDLGSVTTNLQHISIGNKIDKDFAPDATTRGYSLENIVVTGSMTFALQPERAIEVCQQGTWTSEFVNNIVVRDFLAYNATGATSSILVNASGIRSLSLENVYVDAPIAITNAAAGALRMHAVRASGSTISVNGTSLGAGPLSFVSGLKLEASTTTIAQLNLAAGGPPTSPVDGDLWREDNTNTGLKVRINGVTKTITVT